MIFTKKQIKELEAAVAPALSELELMKRAGESAADYILSRTPRGAVAAILCGSGGNGGDGFALACGLLSRGLKPILILCGRVTKNRAASSFYALAIKQAIPVLDAVVEPQRSRDALQSAAVAVDAVYGIGLSAAVPKEFVPIFTAFNALPALKISLDIPSGVYADTGEIDKNAIRPDCTIAFIAKKPAHILKRSRAQCGEITVCDLSIPKKDMNSIKGYTDVTRTSLKGVLARRNPAAHKGSFGRLLCVCGSDSYRGAAVLAARGGVLCGAGITEVASVPSALAAVAAQLPEAVLYDIFANDIKLFVDKVSRASAVVLGCGMSETEDVRKLVELTLLSAKSPLIVDADGIKPLVSDIRLLEETNAPLILTPHLGEFAALCGVSIAEIVNDRFSAAADFAKKHRCIVVLKSENTVVASPKGEVFVLTIGNAGLAKGGSGDLLSGMIGAFCAMGIAPLQSAVLGVYVHAAAADIAVKSINEYSLTASNVAANISAALDSLIE